MVDTTQIDWKAIDSRPEFQELHSKKMGFLWGLMIFSFGVLFPAAASRAAHFQDIYTAQGPGASVVPRRHRLIARLGVIVASRAC